MKPTKKKVLLVGWDAADWKVIQPLVDRGKMPNLERLITNGASGNIATLHPVFSPMLWTSIATGKRPYKHGILGFIEPTADGMGVRPVTSRSRSTKTLWNILDQQGLRSNVVGWWPSHPAEPISGVMVSDQYHKINDQGLRPDNFPLNEASIYPRDRYEELKELRIHPTEIDPDIVKMFIPRAHEIQQDRDNCLFQFLKIFSECNSIHAAATHLMETTEWDFMAVYYDAIDHFSHGFMKYHPPRMPHIREERYEIYKHVVECAYIYHDMMLGRLLELAGPETTVIVVSDHGFHSDHLRPDQLPAEFGGPALEHRDLGIFVVSGEGVKKDSLLFGINLLDVAPTVLQLYGLPVGRDMDGHVIEDAFESKVQTEYVDSWDQIGPSLEEVLPGGADQSTYEETQQALQQLIDLGYIEELSERQEEQVQAAANELEYNLARSYVDAGMLATALPLLAKLHNNNPSEYRFGIQLAYVLKSLGRVEDLEQLVNKLNERRRLDAANALTKLSKYSHVIRERQAERRKKIAEQEAKNEEKGEAPAITVLSGAEQKEFSMLRSLSTIDTNSLDVFQGYVHMAKGEYIEGIRTLEAVLAKSGTRPSVIAMLAEAHIKLKNFDKAMETIRQGLAVDPNSPPLNLAMATVQYRQSELADAVAFARKTIGLRYFYPQAHYLLGATLQRQGQNVEAILSLRRAVAQNPNFAAAHTRLGNLYKRTLQTDLMIEHRQLAAEARRISADRRQERTTLIQPLSIDPEAELAILPDMKLDKPESSRQLPILANAVHDSMRLTDKESQDQIVTIVTGLPRSGTSMMMRMLEAGGMKSFVDQKRLPDEDNPHGYFEAQAVKAMNVDNSFMLDAKGHLVKVVTQLIPYLPAELRYQVILMDRDLDEIILSQKKMLKRSESEHAEMDAKQMRLALSKSRLETYNLLREKGISVYQVPYAAVIDQPSQAAERINRFLGNRLDVDKMISAVDKSLYRNRVKPDLKSIS